MLKLDDLAPGDRIVVRYRREPVDAEASTIEPFSDALGEVLEVTAESVSLQTRKGPQSITRTQITHAKRVPPAPARRVRAPRTGSPESGTPDSRP